MNHPCRPPTIPPTRALRIGLTREEVLAWYNLSEEQLDELIEADDARKAKCRQEPDRPKRGCLMTKLLERPELAGWAFQTVMRRK